MDLLAKNIAIQQIDSCNILSTKYTVLGLGVITCSGNMITSRIQQSLYTAILHTVLEK